MPCFGVRMFGGNAYNETTRRGSSSFAPTPFERLRPASSDRGAPDELPKGGTMSMKERQAALNHRMKAVRNDDAAQGSKFACECADLRCNATLELTGDERTRRTSSPSRFWVKPGHELETERVVERDARYSVVQVDATPFFVVSAPA